MGQWCLSGSSGWDRLTGEFQWSRKAPNGQVVLGTAISISGMFWERAPDREIGDLVPDYSMSLPQVMCDWSAVDNLIFELGEWLDRPKSIEIDLGSRIHNDQTFIIAFEKIERLIDKPACTITYSGTRFQKGVWSFVVDQSCIRNFHDELRAAFADINSQAVE